MILSIVRKLVYKWHSPVPGNIFYSDFPFFRLSLTTLNFCGNEISSKLKKPVFIHIMTTFKTPKLSPETFSMGAYRTPKVGCFFKIVKIHHFCCFITQLVKKLQQWSLYEVIEDILPFVLNTKQPLSDISLVSYKQNNFGCFRKNSEFLFFSSKNTQNCFFLYSPTKYHWEAVLYSKWTAGYPLSPHIKTIAVAFFTSWYITATRMLSFGK